jgi:hypothetical protein
MALITAENLREDFPFVIQSDILDRQLTKSIASASARLKAWVGADVYAAAVAESSETDERKLILQNAEGHLALHYAMLGLNTNLRSFGMVKREQVEGNTVNEYFPPSDVEKFETMYLEKAREIAEPYLLSDGTPSAAFEGVNVSCRFIGD